MTFVLPEHVNERLDDLDERSPASAGAYLRAGGFYLMCMQLAVVWPTVLQSLTVYLPSLTEVPVLVGYLGLAGVLALVTTLVIRLGRGASPDQTSVRRLACAGAGTALAVAVVISTLNSQASGDAGVDLSLLVMLVLYLGVFSLALLSTGWGLLAAVVSLATTLTLGGASLILPFSGLLAVDLIFCRLTMWVHGLIHRMESSRRTIAQLSRDRERQRFSRDLHDIVGRNLSSIALKSELGVTPGARTTATQELTDIRQIAQTCLGELRALIGDTRQIDLDTELDDSCAILRAAGVYVEVEGSADVLPPQTRTVAAWIVREAVTNILRHAPEATSCDIELDGARLLVRNDGVRAVGLNDGHDLIGGTGLNAMRERVAAIGGRLEVDREVPGPTGGFFTIIASFPPGATATPALGGTTAKSAGRSTESLAPPRPSRPQTTGEYLVAGGIYLVGLALLLVWALPSAWLIDHGWSSEPVTLLADCSLVIALATTSTAAILVGGGAVAGRVRTTAGVAVVVALGLGLANGLLGSSLGVLGPESQNAPATDYLVLAMLVTAALAAAILSFRVGLAGAVLVAAVVLGLNLAVPTWMWLGLLGSNLALTRLIWWLRTLLHNLDQARLTIAELTLASERERFSTDVNDVVGRGLSSIALRAELGLRPGSDETVQLGEIRQTAQSTLQELRALVAGYRD